MDLLVQRTLWVGSGEEEIPVVQTGYPTTDSRNPSGCPKYASGKRSFPCHVRDSPHCNGKCQNVTSGFFGRESLDTLRRSPDGVSRESVRVTIRLGSFPVRNLLAAPTCDLEKAAFLRQGGSLGGPEGIDDRWSQFSEKHSGIES